MYIGIRQKKKILMFSVVFVFLLVLLSGAIFSGKGISEDFLRASEPSNLVLSNFAEDSVTVTWTTQVKAEGYLILHKNGEQVGVFKDSRNLSKGYTHFVNITNLEQGTTYEFEIFSAGERRLNAENEMFEFKTKEVQENIVIPNIVTGFFGDQEDLLVFIILDDMSLHYPVSSSVAGEGVWSVDLSKLAPFESLREDMSLRVMFYGEDGANIFRGNKNVLFDNEGKFAFTPFELDPEENPFVYISDLAKFKGIIVENKTNEIEEELEEVEVEEVEEEVLGVVEEDVEIENNGGVKWEKLDKEQIILDYGINEN